MRFHRRLIAIPTLTLASVLAFAPAALAQALDDQGGGDPDGTAQSHRDDYAWDAENDHWHYIDRANQSNSAVQSRSDQSNDTAQSRSDQSNDTAQSRSHDDSSSDGQGDSPSTANHRNDSPDGGES